MTTTTTLKLVLSRRSATTLSFIAIRYALRPRTAPLPSPPSTNRKPSVGPMKPKDRQLTLLNLSTLDVTEVAEVEDLATHEHVPMFRIRRFRASFSRNSSHYNPSLCVYVCLCFYVSLRSSVLRWPAINVNGQSETPVMSSRQGQYHK